MEHGTDAVEDHTDTERPFRFPPHRTFVVRKYMGGANGPELKEYWIKAHMVQFLGPQHAQFFDFELAPDHTPTTRLHRIMYNVEEVEDIDRVEPPSTQLITH